MLRAELAEMELRLRVWISGELEKKASMVEVSDLRTRVAALELLTTDPRIREMVHAQIVAAGIAEDAGSRRRWTPWERALAVLLGVVATASFVVSSLQPWNWGGG